MAKYRGQCIVDESSGIIHHPNCQWVDKIGSQSRRSYASVRDAARMGYAIHRDCLAEWYFDGGRRKDLTSSELVKRAGISLRQLYYWELKLGGALRPKVLLQGHRAFRRYSERDAQLVHTIKELVDDGYTLQAAMRKAKERPLK